MTNETTESRAELNEREAFSVPLLERLQSVPANAVLRIDTPNAIGSGDTRSIPVGAICHEAAAAIGQAARSHPQVQAAPVVPQWLPIETAPKDGRTILLGHYNSLGKWRTLRGQWFSAATIAETWEDDECPEGWYETSVECDDDVNAWRSEPTRWMPLPPEPERENARLKAPLQNCPTPPKPAKADAVDAKRLDWLEAQNVAFGFVEGNHLRIERPYRGLRKFIDAAIASQEKQQ